MNDKRRDAQATKPGIQMIGFRGRNDSRDAPKTLERIQWHLSRCDQIRSNLANRAAITLSANALTVAGSTTFLASATDSLRTAPTLLKYLSAAGGFCVLTFSATSIIYAIQAIVNIRTWRRVHGEDVPISLFYHQSDTARNVATYADFKDRFHSATDDELVDYALADLWMVIRTVHLRHTRFRRSVRFLLASLLSLVISSSFLTWLRMLFE
ncbi:hypothetical protein [Actinoallomurus iriomotensis]|uniref:Pycsar effector protein domain-containing protein n=1 Tax=Actinoallomurus iriomotensis TaxID=478107 RepID=A0A9W6W209_9ACTN|nr:hypothetical protein [Actinoallomurus iriomotensis]GLY87382.1 hypothetical protein Airi02_053110 [Actinoallomurus iriomotensis]